MNIYPWQTSQWDFLQKARAHHRLAHALLFYGAKGLGKNALALIFIKALLCESKQSLPCGICKACHLFAANTHPDFFYIRPQEDAKTIKVEAIRNLSLELSKTATQTKKVILITPADAMQHATANALLKILEEPIGDTLFILICEQQDVLLPTIRSRCQKIYFYADQNVALQWLLQDARDVQTLEAQWFLSYAQGAPLTVGPYSVAELKTMRDTLFLKLLDIKNQKQSPLEVAQCYVKENITILVSLLFSLCMDLLRLQYVKDKECLVNKDQLSYLELLLAFCNAQHLIQWFQHLQQVQRWLNHPGINVQLLLEGIFIRWESQ